MTAPTSVILNDTQPGYQPVATREPALLTASQTFPAGALVATVTATGAVSPFTSSGTAALGIVAGLLDPAFTGGSSLTTPASPAVSVPVLAGQFSMANGTSTNEFTAADVGLIVYTADGVTANKTSSSNPKPGGGTTGGIPCGILSIQNPANNITFVVDVLVVPEFTASVVVGAVGDMLLASSQTVTGPKTFQHATLLVDNSGNTFATTLASAATAARTVTFPDATATMAQASVATAATTPTFTGSSVSPAPGSAVTGLTGTSTGQTVTLTTTGVTLNQYRGGFLFDGTTVFPIVSNAATVTTTTAFVVFGSVPATTITGTGQIIPVGVTAAGSVSSHTHVQS